MPEMKQLVAGAGIRVDVDAVNADSGHGKQPVQCPQGRGKGGIDARGGAAAAGVQLVYAELDAVAVGPADIRPDPAGQPGTGAGRQEMRDGRTPRLVGGDVAQLE